MRIRHLLSTCILAYCSTASATRGAEVQIYFSPHGGVATEICKRLDSAKTRIWLTIYSLSEPNITQHLVAAKARGIDVQIHCDPGQQSDDYSTCPKLQRSGINVLPNATHQLEHNKLCVIDRETVITGSANWTRSADQANGENLVIITDPTTATAVADRFTQDTKSCSPFVPHHGKGRGLRKTTPPPPPPPPTPTQKGAT